MNTWRFLLLICIGTNLSISDELITQMKIYETNLGDGLKFEFSIVKEKSEYVLTFYNDGRIPIWIYDTFSNENVYESAPEMVWIKARINGEKVTTSLDSLLSESGWNPHVDPSRLIGDANRFKIDNGSILSRSFDLEWLIQRYHKFLINSISGLDKVKFCNDFFLSGELKFTACITLADESLRHITIETAWIEIAELTDSIPPNQPTRQPQ